MKRGRKLTTGRFDTREELEEVVVTRFRGDYSTADIAAACRISVETVLNIVRSQDRKDRLARLKKGYKACKPI